MKTITKHYIDGAVVESPGREVMDSINGLRDDPQAPWGRIQALGRRPRIRYIRDRGVSRTTGHSQVTALAWPNESNMETSS
jgi:hypothetical protein